MGSRPDLLEKTLRTPQECHLSIEATTGTIKCELIPLITTRKSESWELAATSTFTIAASEHQGTYRVDMGYGFRNQDLDCQWEK